MARLSPQSRRIDGSAAAALGVWLGVQVAGLGVCAMRLRFWAHSPGAGEQLGVFVMLAVQVAASSLMFPVLLRNWRSSLIAAAVGWPLAELAGFLADAQSKQWMAGELYVSIWLLTLYLWAGALQNSWQRAFAAAVAGMLSLGGPVLWYLRSEFGAGEQRVNVASFGPIGGAISQIIPNGAGSAWVILAVLLASGAVGRAASIHRSRFGDKLSTKVIH